MRFVIFILCLLSVSCASYDKKMPLSSDIVIQDIDLTVSIPDEKFDYIDEHMTTSMTSIALFSAVGYAAVSAYNEALDGEKRSYVSNKLNDISYADIIHHNLANKLKEYNISVKEGSEIIFYVKAQSWGLRRINKDTNKVRPFFDLMLVANQGKHKIWNERKLFLADQDRSFADYKNDQTLLSKDFEMLAKKLSENIAYNLIYK